MGQKVDVLGISQFNIIARTQKIQAHNVDALLCSMNSYLGIMCM